MTKRPEELEPIIERVVGHVVDSALQRSGGDYGFVDVKRWLKIEKAWKPNLEGFITERVVPVGYRRGVVYVACRSAAMEQELVYIKDLILTTLRAVLPGVPLEDIRATLKAKPAKNAPPERNGPGPWMSAPNTQDEIDYANKSVAGMSSDLAEDMRKLILLGLRAERLSGK